MCSAGFKIKCNTIIIDSDYKSYLICGWLAGKFMRKCISFIFVHCCLYDDAPIELCVMFIFNHSTKLFLFQFIIYFFLNFFAILFTIWNFVFYDINSMVFFTGYLLKPVFNKEVEVKCRTFHSPSLSSHFTLTRYIRLL